MIDVTGAHRSGDDGLTSDPETGHRDPDQPSDIGPDSDTIKRGDHDVFRQMARQDLVDQTDKGRHDLLKKNREGDNGDGRAEGFAGQSAGLDLTGCRFHRLRLRRRLRRC